MVMRFLNSDAEMLSLDTLISNEKVRQDFRSILNEANGIIIVSGPTGSGKSTTLASALREKDNGISTSSPQKIRLNTTSAETFSNSQLSVPKDRLFAQLLRTFLRQDPDVILIGETCDPKPESSMDAAETGHLVFTTLHANSAASSLTRLMDMEVRVTNSMPPYAAYWPKRLLRRVCPECSVQRPINDAESYFTGLQPGTPVRFATMLSAEEKQQRKQEGTICAMRGEWLQGTGRHLRIDDHQQQHS